jgi:hypothetical protein
MLILMLQGHETELEASIRVSCFVNYPLEIECASAQSIALLPLKNDFILPKSERIGTRKSLKFQHPLPRFGSQKAPKYDPNYGSFDEEDFPL